VYFLDHFRRRQIKWRVERRIRIIHAVDSVLWMSSLTVGAEKSRALRISSVVKSTVGGVTPATSPASA